jgi:hypothetical protein
MLKQSIRAVALACALIASTGAVAHDDPKPRHGGTVQVVNDVSYELVPRNGSVEIHVSDHGKPVPTAGMSGRLTIMVGSQTSNVELVATGDRLEARGVSLSKGAKVVAVLATAKKSAVTVRFTVR